MKKTIQILFLLITQLPVFGQQIVQQEDYYELKTGIYETQSLDTNLIGLKPAVIEPQTALKNGKNTAFLKVQDKVIALFDQINDKGEIDPVGVLTKTSVVQVDTIFYNEIFSNTTEKWSLTFNVWYAIKINDQTYYTDYKIHDFVSLQKSIPQYSQKFLLVAQSTGYEEYYDKGYPNLFFIVILNDKDEIAYDSDILDFNYGDEFLDEKLMWTVSTKMTAKGFEFKINGLDETFEGVWTGSELKK
jgi:hypothetical protein